METLEFYPFAYALLNDEVDNFCWYCLDEAPGHKRCSGCKKAHFCGKECQLLGWEDHKIECKALAKTDGIPSVEIRMLGRIVSRHKRIESGRAEEVPYFYHQRSSERGIMQLAHHAEDIRRDPPAYAKFTELLDQLKRFYGEKNLMEDETVFQLHCRNYINRHAISDRNYMREIGKGLYLDLCAYNHSCRPNVIYTCEGLVATLRPLHDKVDIRNKETTFYTYIDLIAHKAQRRKELVDTWYFNCECARCVDEGEHVLTATVCPECGETVPLFGTMTGRVHCGAEVPKERALTAFEAMKFVDLTIQRGEISEMSKPQARKFIEGFLSSYRGKLLPKVNVFHAKFLQQAIMQCEGEEWGKLLEYHLDAEECMRVCFPLNHPGLAYHLMNIGIFLARLQRHKEAKPYLDEARKMIHFTLGEDHPMALNLRAFEDGNN